MKLIHVGEAVTINASQIATVIITQHEHVLFGDFEVVDTIHCAQLKVRLLDGEVFIVGEVKESKKRPWDIGPLYDKQKKIIQFILDKTDNDIIYV